MQVAHLEDWETLEEEHSSALTGAMEALESTILRVPVAGGAKVYRNFSDDFFMHRTTTCKMSDWNQNHSSCRSNLSGL